MDLGAVTDNDVEAVGHLLAASFADDPAPVWWWPEPEVRTEFAPPFFAAVTRLAIARGDGQMTAAGDAVGLYLPPGTQLAEDDVIRAGLPELLGKLDARTAEDIGRFVATLGELHAGAMPEPHWQLYLIGVHPATQGKGRGVALVDEVNNRAERDGVGVYLDTLTERNVAFYEHRGYRVVAEADIPGSDVHVWGMRFN
jgi:ribosomal protein S18 acetylase RimI-like enzyme